VSKAISISTCRWSGLNRAETTDDELYGIVHGRTGY
jgi:hypothetical protein